MKEIQLTQGFFVQVDDSDFNWLNQWKWHAVKNRNTFFARRNGSIKHNKSRGLVYMHRIIMDAPKNMQVDHIDHNGLNNQKSNLRICNNSQNHMNRTPWGSSKYLGVHIKLKGKYIQSQIKANGKTIHLGLFKTEEEAAMAYDRAAKFYFGEFANLNFK